MHKNPEKLSNSINIKIPMHVDVWIGNAMENFYRLVKGIESCSVKIEEDDTLNIRISDQEKFISNLTNIIKQKQDEIIFVKKQDKKGQIRYVKKDFVLIQYGKASGGRNVLKEKIYSKTKKRLGEIISNIGEGNKICVVCGNNFKKAGDRLKQAVYPFATKIKSLSGVRVLKESYDNLCPMCYLIGTLEWLDEGIIYRCFLGNGSYSVIFFPYEFNLLKLHRSKKDYTEILKPNNGSRISNLMKTKITKEGIEKKICYEGEFSTILRFFEEFIYKIIGEYKEEDIGLVELLPRIERKICKSWIMIQIPSGQVKNVKYKHLHLEDEILRLLVSLERKGIFLYDNIIDKIGVKDKNNKPVFDEINNAKEILSKSIVQNNFRMFSKIFLPKKNKVIYFGDSKDLNELIKLWRLKEMELGSEIDNLKSAGKCLAILLEEHLSILYNMDKAKTKEDLLRAIEQASKRLLDDKKRENVYGPSLEKITDLIIKSGENKWQTIRDILLIYTSVSLAKNKYIRGDKK